MKMTMDQMILLSQGRPPYRGKKCVYYEDPRFKEKALTPPAFTNRKELFGMGDEEWGEKKKARDAKTKHWYDIGPEALLPEAKDEKQSNLMTFAEQMRLMMEGNKNQNKAPEKKDEKTKTDEIETEEEMSDDEIFEEEAMTVMDAFN
jgi:type IV secretory pathway TraG/TraD family ATPase VirD4